MKPPEPDLESTLESEEGTLSQNSKKKPSSKLPAEDMRNLISEFYHSDKSLFRFVKDKGLRSNYIAIQRHWRGSTLQELKDKSVPLTHALPVFDRFIQADKERIAKRNKERASVLKKLPEEFEAFMLCLITEMATCGKGLGRRTVKSLVEGCLREYKLSDTKTAFSQKTFERFLKKI